MKLIIVESPTKAKTISSFLPSDYQVRACLGHVRDLPKSKLGIEIEKNFLPHYLVPKKSKKIVKELKNLSLKAKEVILATDQDREGEAIAWHLLNLLPLKNYQRIVFSEITKKAILEALASPRKIDFNLVNAWQARRILDRLVGYKLSPFLWQKVAHRLSAGRVQSAALRLIVEREKEIKKFKPKTYFTIEAQFEKENQKFSATLFEIKGKKLSLTEIDEKKAQEILKEIKPQFQILEITRKKITKKPPPPLITSTLQQEAYNLFRFSSKKTMLLAQRLYEGFEIEGKPKGLITYMRTDSLNLAPLAIEKVREFIEKNFGKAYLPKVANKFQKKPKLAQEAHEAIRPTQVELTPQKIKKYLPQDEFKLYSLIWERFVASQLKPAELERIEIKLLSAKFYKFKASGQRILFEGFLKVLKRKTKEIFLPPLKEGEILLAKKIEALKHQTQPPPRYNDASLVKTLEALGIGRPSTYATIISTLINRGYVRREKRGLIPSEIGILVADLLKIHFPEIVDYQFTAKMEKNLDLIASGKKSYLETLKQFWFPFKETLEKKYQEVKKVSFKTSKKCPLCGRPLIKRVSRYGWFLSCSGFPECKYKENFSVIEFFDKLIKPILYDVGDLWKQNKLLIGTEHVISNRINTVIKQTVTYRKKRTHRESNLRSA